MSNVPQKRGSYFLNKSCQIVFQLLHGYQPLHYRETSSWAKYNVLPASGSAMLSLCQYLHC